MKSTLRSSLLIASCFAGCVGASAQFIPGDLKSVGLTNAVPDVPIWYDGTANRVKIGPIVPLANQLADHSTWEPWVGVVGEKVFLIECNKYADDGQQANQRYVVALQPAAAGTAANAKLADGFFDDTGVPYTNAISSRQDGNPGRVYGDRRYDGVNFVVGGEADPQDQGNFFNSGNRFDPNTVPLYQNAAGLQQRCGLMQCFSLNMTTLKQTPTCLAFDGNSLGHPEFLQRADASNQQRGRFGGGIAALDNGNFAAAFNDRSPFFDGGNPGNETIAMVFKPDGTAITNAFLVSPVEAWSDPCGFKGGFCVRAGSTLNFYDNTGLPIAVQVDFNSLSGLSQSTGRGDGDKITSDIRSPYVYYTSGGWLTVWNGTNGAYLAQYKYTDQMDDTATHNRVDVGCDSQGTVCIAWDGKPTNLPVGTNSDQVFANNQIMARVFRFNGSTVTPITSTFFPFINHDGDTNSILGYKMENSNVDMTTRYICIAGKGLINSTNNWAAGPDSAAQTTVYTVINNPAYVAPKLTATVSGANLVVTWPASAGDCQLQSTTSVKPTAWAPVSPQPATALVNGDTYQKTVSIAAGNSFFRLVSP